MREGCVSLKVRCKEGVCFWNWNVRGVCACGGAMREGCVRLEARWEKGMCLCRLRDGCVFLEVPCHKGVCS